MRVALIGASGQLGSDLQSRLSGEVIPLNHQDLELRNEAGLKRVLDGIAPDVVINTAAYNLVDRAEEDAQSAFEVNAFGARRLAQYCGHRDKVLVHFSTDYVFGLDATRSKPYCETDAPGPIGVYGASKLCGEYFVQAICPKHFVIRTCGLYGAAARRGAGKGNFVEKMLQLAADRPQLRVVADQVCTPTSTIDLANVIQPLLNSQQYGLYHVTNSGSTSWFELAAETLRLSGLKSEVVPITTAEFGAKAARPRYSVLNCDRLVGVTGCAMPDWHAALSEYLRVRSV